VHRVPLDEIVAWLHDALAPALAPRTDSAPDHWQPMHGDFAPWNLRRYAAGPLALVDFEEVAYAPPHADVTYWHAARAALRNRAPEHALDDEACDFWLAAVDERLAHGVDPAQNTRLAHALRGHGGAAR
jgi:aminoglycoside phosphotransferase (APT) family kinase protein